MNAIAFSRYSVDAALDGVIGTRKSLVCGCVLALTLFMSGLASEAAIAAQPTEADLQTCESASADWAPSPEAEARRLARKLGGDENAIEMRDGVAFFASPDKEIAEAIRNFPTQESARRPRGAFCNAMCANGVIEGCGVLIGCVLVLAGEQHPGVGEACTGVWFVASQRMKDRCRC